MSKVAADWHAGQWGTIIIIKVGLVHVEIVLCKICSRDTKRQTEERFSHLLRSGDWELAGEGEKETAIQKYQRLQCEMRELLDEVAELKEVAKDESNKQPCTALSRQVESLVKQLTELRLEEKLGSELVGSLTDPQGAQFK
ncbi:Dynactin subunit 2 [Homalodisca vitripennis]|nr:Dynactin subunit 2 [Homalodisca vitripennis]KAG8274809.1 Dynactin subunit 2 [Homalodisca vitripennis]